MSGIGNINPMKMARCIVELERIYGIKVGNPQLRNNFVNKTQSELSQNIGIDERQLQNYKKLNDLIPEFQELVEEGKLKATTAYKIWAKLPQDEQEKFFNEIGGNEISKMTQKQTQEYLQLQEEVNQLKSKLKNQPVKEVGHDNLF